MKLTKQCGIAVAMILLMLTMTGLPSCEKKQEKFTAYSFDYFDTVTTVVGYADSQKEFDRISEEIFAALSEYHRLFTIYDRYEDLENLCTVNDLVDGKHRTVTVDRRIIDFLLYAREMYALTEGKVNIAMGSVLSLWHDYRQNGISDPQSAALPPMDRLSAAAEHTDIADLVIDAERNTVTLTDPEMRLDVGAIAKGYAVSKVAETLRERGITGYMLNVGGNIQAIGAKADGTAWVAGLEHPNPDATDFLAYVDVLDGALVTSGSYQRYYVVDGREYHHIIDPATLMPADYYTSVSVLCDHSALGDALSTALFCMPLEQGMALVASLNGVEAMWLTTDGVLHHSAGFPR